MRCMISDEDSIKVSIREIKILENGYSLLN